MVRRLSLLALLTAAVALPMTAVWAQSTARTNSGRTAARGPSIGERIGNFGREFFGGRRSGGFVGDPFAPEAPSSAESANREARQPRRAVEHVASNPNAGRRAPAMASDIEPTPQAPPFDPNVSNRRRRPGDEEILTPPGETTAAIPRRESRSDFTQEMDDNAPLAESQTLPSRQPRQHQQRPAPGDLSSERYAELPSPAETRPTRRAPERGYAPERARGYDPRPSRVTVDDRFITSRPHGGNSLPSDEAGGPKIIRNEHVAGPRAGSNVGLRERGHETAEHRIARSPEPVETPAVDSGQIEAEQGEAEQGENELVEAAPAEAEATEAADAEAQPVEVANSHKPSDSVPAETAVESEPAVAAESPSAVEPVQVAAEPATVDGEVPASADVAHESNVAASDAALADSAATATDQIAPASDVAIEEQSAPVEEAAPEVVATDVGAAGLTVAERLAAARRAAPVARTVRAPAATNIAATETAPASETAPAPTQESTAPTTTVAAEPQSLVGIPTPVTSRRDRLASAESSAARQARAELQANRSAPPAAREESVLLTKQSPVLEVETIGPRTIKVGQPARYRVVVHNSGSVVAEGLTLSVALPEWAEVVAANASTGSARMATEIDRQYGVEWRAGNVEPGARQSLELEIAAGRSKPLELDVRWALAPQGSQTRVAVEEPKLEMHIDGPDEVDYGQTERYVLEVSNPGNGDADGIVVRLLPDNPESDETASQEIGTVRAGETKSIELELSAHKSGSFWIRAEAEGAGNLQASVSAEVLIRRAALQVAIEGPEFLYAGTEATYRVRVANTGNAAARNVELQTLVPSEAVHVSSTEASRLELAKGRIVWGLVNLAAGEAREFELCCKLVAPGTVRPQALCTADDDLTASDGVETTVEAVADLSLDIRDPSGPVRVGDKARYEIRVTNRGTSAAHDVDVAAFFAEGVEPIEATGAEYRMADGQVVFEKIATLAAGEELLLVVVARAATAGKHAFRAEVTCPELETNLAADESTMFYTPGNSTVAPERHEDEPTPAAAVELDDAPAPGDGF